MDAGRGADGVGAPTVDDAGGAVAVISAGDSPMSWHAPSATLKISKRDNIVSLERLVATEHLPGLTSNLTNLPC
jgi:hypothetical protein